MKRATNKCAWLRRSRKENCGKPCVGEYSKQHNYQLKQGGKLPTPCRVCGVGIFCDSGICISCGGATPKNGYSASEKKRRKGLNVSWMSSGGTPETTRTKNLFCVISGGAQERSPLKSASTKAKTTSHVIARASFCHSGVKKSITRKAIKWKEAIMLINERNPSSKR